MAISRRWCAWQADFWLWQCSNSLKWRFQGAGALGRLIFQYAKMAISRRWRAWQADFWLWRCSNSPKWRLKGAGALNRPIFGLGSVPILKNCDFKAPEPFAGAGALVRLIFGFGGVPIRQKGDFETLAKFQLIENCQIFQIRNFGITYTLNKLKRSILYTGSPERSIFGQGGVPILQNGDFQALAHFTGQFSALAVFQFAKIAISMCWCAWQTDFRLWRCSNSPKWRFQGAGALGRLIFGFGSVPILKNGDFQALAHFTGQFLALAVFQFSKIAISRRLNPLPALERL